jgi:hypothetical protein
MRYYRHGRGLVLRQSSSLLPLDCLSSLSQGLKRQAEKAAEGADKVGWMLTGRIDLTDPQSVGALVLEVEETRISMSPSGVEHREIRWRRATLPEAKMVLESYHAQQNLAMSATFTATAIAGTKRKVNGQAD